MKHFYIAPVTNSQPYRPDIPATRWSCAIPSKPDGTPKYNWCLVLVSGSQAVHDAVDAAPGVRSIPIDKDNIDDVVGNHVGDTPWGLIVARMNQIGVDTSGMDKNTTTLRQVVRAIGQVLDFNFRENHLDAS